MKKVFLTFMTLAALLVLALGFAELSEGQMGGRDRDRNRFEGPIDDFPLTALPRDFDAPPDNPQTPEKVELGRLLFWDPILSGNQRVACATCHHPDFGYAEDLDLSIGVDGAGLGGDRRSDVGAPSINHTPFGRLRCATLLTRRPICTTACSRRSRTSSSSMTMSGIAMRET